MAKIELTNNDIDLGTVAGDGTGSPARTGGGLINTNNQLIETAINDLASENWSNVNASTTIALGEKYMCNSFASTITITLPTPAPTISTVDYNTCVIVNGDSNNNVNINPQANQQFYYKGVALGNDVDFVLRPGWMAVVVARASTDWNLFVSPAKDIGVTDLADYASATPAIKDVLGYTASGWDARTPEEADLVERSVSAFESTPYLTHTSLGTITTGTANITMTSQPSVYVPVGGNNVTIALNAPALSLPARGLNDVKLCGKVFVKCTTAVSGLSVSTTASSSVIKGNAPSANGEWAILCWEWFEDGTNADFVWAEWVNQV